MAFARDELRLSLFPGQLEILQAFQHGPYHWMILNVGRQSGKSHIADILALFDALARDYLRDPGQDRAGLRPGQQRLIAIMAQNEEEAKRHITEISVLVQNSRAYADLVTHTSTTEIGFSNGSLIKAFPCSARAIRGRSASSLILDEFGHLEEVAGSQQDAEEVMRSASPVLAHYGNEGWLFILSTPGWRDSEYGRIVTQAEKFPDPDVLYIHRATAQMRPDMVKSGFLEKERRKNPDKYVQEYEAVFRDTSGAYLEGALVQERTRTAGNLPPREGVRYVGAIDPAFQIDWFALAIGHKDETGLIVIDGIWAWRKQGVENTIRMASELAAEYGIQELLTDQHAFAAVREALDRHRVFANYRPWTPALKADAFGRLKMAVDMGRVEFPNDPDLFHELCSIRAVASSSGITRFVAMSGHDDRAVAVAAVVYALDRNEGPVAIFADSDGQRYAATPDSLDEDGDPLWPSQWSRGAIIG